MGKSNKPMIWGPFAAGGTITAFVTPVLIVLTLLVALGQLPDALTYEGLRRFAGHWFGKLAIVVVLSLSLWTSAHRLRITFYDLGVRSDTLVATAVYLVAALGTVAAFVILLRV
jgi:fumarate reductase subunit D